MAIDRELYREAYRAHREWNEAVAADHARSAGQLHPLEAWRQYVALVQFCWRLCPEQSRSQREQKLAALDRYIDRVQRLEAWRRDRGAMS